MKLAYCKLSLHYLFAKLAKSEINIMAIGSKNPFMINARTSHKQHFVGTRQAIGLHANAGNKHMLERL